MEQKHKNLYLTALNNQNSEVKLLITKIDKLKEISDVICNEIIRYQDLVTDFINFFQAFFTLLLNKKSNLNEITIKADYFISALSEKENDKTDLKIKCDKFIKDNIGIFETVSKLEKFISFLITSKVKKTDKSEKIEYLRRHFKKN